MEPTKTLRVSIWRGEASEGDYQRYAVPARANQTVLDVVTWVQQNADPTLSYRFACRVGMCGSCAMMVNGQPRWTCRTHISKVIDANEITIAPLRNLPVIKDLVTDMEPFFDKWVQAGGHHHPSATRSDPIPTIAPDGPQRSEASKGIECINCAICYAACDTVSHNPEYLGPAALQRAWTLFNDVKEVDGGAILDAVSGQGGCHNCHSQGSCSHFCPNDLDPMHAIAGLKRASARSFFTRGKPK